MVSGLNENLDYKYCHGQEGRKYLESIANLRLEVFFEYPYLYEGEMEYEKKYLETYFQSSSSLLFLVFHQNELIGATSCLKASDEEESFKKPFDEKGMNPGSIYYFGESLLKVKWRGKGLGKRFFHVREEFARRDPATKFLAFASVVRDDNHPMKPHDYRNHHHLWKKMGFNIANGLETSYSWRDRGEAQETTKKMQFWMKEI